MLIGTDLLRLLTQGATAVLFVTGQARVWEVLLLQMLFGAGQAFFRPASTGFVPEIVDPEDRQSANSLLSMSANMATIAGPPLAAIIVAVAGAGWALGVDALSFGLSAILLASIPGGSGAAAATGSMLHELAAGWQTFRSRSWLVAMVGAFATYHLVVFAPLMVLGPLVALRSRCRSRSR